MDWLEDNQIICILQELKGDGAMRTGLPGLHTTGRIADGREHNWKEK